MNVKLGKEIKSPGSEFGLRETSFSYLTESRIVISDLNARYEEDNRRIAVKWTPVDLPGNITLFVRHSMNSSAFTTAQISASEGTFYITGVLPPNAGGVRSGNSVSGINRYTIFLDLGEDMVTEDTRTIEIWNIPGMFVNRDNPTVLLTQETIYTALVAEASANKYFTLTEDIFLFDWIPVGSEDKPFLGSFYGNGHTITIRSFEENGINGGSIGLFAVVGGKAIVRDLTVDYQNAAGGTVVINPTETTVFGGIAGQTTEEAQLLNVLVKGDFHLNMDASMEKDEEGEGRDIYAGGITGVLGRMPVLINAGNPDSSPSKATIRNAYSSLDFEVNRRSKLYYVDTPFLVNILVGGIAGVMGRLDIDDGEGDPVVAQDISIVGNITVGGETKAVGTTDWADSGLFVGGLAGTITGGIIGKEAELLNCDYRDGSIQVFNNTGLLVVGGAVGKLAAGSVKIRDCISRGSILKAEKDGWGFGFSIGGFIGEIGGQSKFLINGILENCYGEYPIDVTGSDHVGPPVGDGDKTTTTPGINAGGFLGHANINEGEMKIQHCYASGDIKAEGFSGIDVGGFAGDVRGDISILSCYAKGDLNVTVLRGVSSVSAGGFVGVGSTFINCYALGNVKAHKKENSIQEPTSIQHDFIGGFVGNLDRGLLDRCFAKGTITATRDSNLPESGDPIYAGGLVGYVYHSELKNSAALGTKIEVSGNPGKDPEGIPKNHFIGRVYGHDDRNDPNFPPLPETHAFDGMEISVDGNQINEGLILSGTPELNMYTIFAPVMNGTLLLNSDNVNNASITGINIETPCGMGIRNSYLDTFPKISDPEGPKNNGTWNGTDAITGIDLGILADDETLFFNITLYSNAGSSSLYSIEVIRNSSNSDFDINGPTLYYLQEEFYSVEGLSITDSNNYGIQSVDITCIDDNGNPTYIFGTPFWEEADNTITKISLSALENNASIHLDLTIKDLTGVTSLYRITISKNNNGDLSASAPEWQGGTAMKSDKAGPHGADLSIKTMLSATFWLGTLNFNSASSFGSIRNVWNFSSLQGMGYPVLNGPNGKPMPGQ
jgi:hypothetical protein